ncbi:MAG: TaqI-like C-terminal specificity domain-containing protein [Candidatus Bipolaricaulis anaerobius]|nr:TaqI-like C-terminal specificity domain-containing protein [Candidatus Bipolaricaulis anaerobius]
MAAPREVRTLIQRFQGNRAAYVSGPYNETQLRREFLDPFFTALGWDVANVSGAAEAYKDVVHEDAIKIGGATKAPDYCFRIGGTRKFFVEAKRPSVRIKDDASSAYQLRRYAWSAKLPLSILTTFAELSVHDCRVKPDKKDPASTARILYLTWEEYEPRWDEIAGIFSKEAVYKGSFDRYAESTKKKRGTAEVDTAFLKEIEGWRDELARNIALRNPELSQRELNFAVQRTIDRIIFLRICEDRGIEEYGRLLALLNSQRVYPRLCEIFHRADERYNSGLFHFRPEKGRAEPPDELTLRITIDDKVLKEIIRNLYYPDSPYEFSVLPADILGQVYEQFLGKVIRLTPGHRAVVEDKPEVRKAGGIYYTPTYIVDYIVKNTVGELLKGKTPQEVGGLTENWRPSKKLHPLRVLDPACGSGSFLLGAYQYLLDWYRDRYVEDGAEKHATGRNPRLYRVGLPSPAAGRGFPRSPSPSGRGQGEGEWRLTTAERKRILLTHIYGVDIDPQAVEVTKLSLLLKVLEGETQETLDSFYRLFQERALPDLGRNIKCGNSLIGPDFYETAAAAGLDREELLRINPFDWHTEFPEVFSGDNPGFDAVIGNPPYIFGELHLQATKRYLSEHYEVAHDQYDTYWLFIERSLSLLNTDGHFSMIVPDALLARDVAAPVRGLLLKNGLRRVYHCGPVFPAAVSSVVVVTAKRWVGDEIAVDVRQGGRFLFKHACSAQRFRLDPHLRLLVNVSDEEAGLLGRLTELPRQLQDYVTISRGEEMGKKNVSRQGTIPILVGEDISRYYINPPTRLIAAIRKKPELYRAPKIVVVKTGVQPIAALDRTGYVTMQSLYNLHLAEKVIPIEAVLAVLNSRLVGFLVARTFTAYKRVFPQLNQTTLASIPMPSFLPAAAQAVATKVQTMLDLHKQLAAAKTEHEKTALQRQIAATDRQIDHLVYELYGLTEEEIKIVEEAGK